MAEPAAFAPLGVHRYLPGKDLALFAWRPARMPAPDSLACRSTFAAADGSVLPEFDRFGLFEWEAALTRTGKNMARVLAEVRAAASRHGAGPR